MIDLQSKALVAEQGRNGAIVEKQKATAMLSELRIKYRELLHSKTAMQVCQYRAANDRKIPKSLSTEFYLQSELITSEEERLKASKALIDMQMAENDIREELAKDKYEIETKLLCAESEIAELKRKQLTNWWMNNYRSDSVF